MSVRTRAALNTIASFLLAMVLFGIILAISNKHQKTYDATKDKRLSLSEQSLNLVRNLQTPVRAVVFTNDYDVKAVEKVLEKYKVANPTMFSYSVLDSVKNPGKAKAYAVQYNGTGVLELVEPNGGDEPGKRQERLNDLQEATITNALLKLSERSELKIGFLTGHGERSIEEKQPMGMLGLKNAIEPEAYRPVEFSLASVPRVPEDFAAVVIASPQSALLENEAEGLRNYLNGGGRLLFEYDVNTHASYAALLAGYGLDVPAEMILSPDKFGRFTQDAVIVPGLPLKTSQHPVVKEQRDQVVMALVHPVRPGDSAKSNGYASEALITSESKECLAVPAEAVLGKTDIKVDTSKLATYPLAAVSSKKMATPAASPTASPSASPSPAPDAQRESRIAVLGGEMLSNQLLPAAGNRDFAVNLLSWLVQAESRITIRPSEETSKPLVLGEGVMWRIILVQLLLMPAIFLLIGILSAVRRR